MQVAQAHKASHSQALIDLIDAQRPGWSLEQPFYTDETIFAFERRTWMARQWVLIGHASEMPKPGSHIVRDLFGESIIIVRSKDDRFDAFFNVCTHRGSRLCKADGRSPLLVCPYHAWAFKLTGELNSRRDVPEGVDPETLSLRPVAIHVAEGLIFCALPGEDLPDPAPAFAALGPALKQHGVRNARIVARKSYPANANWKLVLENGFECYHCPNAHPEYTRINGQVKVIGSRDPQKAQSWARETEAWAGTIVQTGGFDVALRDAGTLDRLGYSAIRHPIGDGRRTLTKDGAPIAKLMGGFGAYDNAETQFRFGRLSFASAANDYVTLIQMQPVSAQRTEMIFTWLVDADADAALDPDPISWMWDVTTIQDKQIIEDNAAGVRSSAYRPGPYTALEHQTAAFVAQHLSELRSLATRDGECFARVPTAQLGGS